MHTRIAPGAVLLLGFWAASAADQPPSLGDKVVDFCKSRKGEQVGSGECSDLAQAALRSAGARTRGKDAPSAGDYTWGELVLVLEPASTGVQVTKGKLGDVRPGDVLQFRDSKFEGTQGGGKGAYWMGFGHHTAVVAGVEKEGKVVKIYHQNYGGKRVVMDGTLYPKDLKKGWVRVYRPMPNAARK